MPQKNDEEKARTERARAVGLFRYAVIREAADPSLTARQRGALVRELAAAEHRGPFGAPVKVSRETLDRWIRAWRTGGFDALVPAPRNVVPRTAAGVLATAVALKREAPSRTAAQVAAVLREHAGWAPSDRTLQRHFAAHGLNAPASAGEGGHGVFGRFEAEGPNERWTGDALHGPVVGGGKAILFAFIDDNTRLLTGYRWAHREDTVRMEAALRAGIAARGIPRTVYVDNGSPFVDAQFLRALASLGIRLVHSRPGRPQGRGKIERYFRTVREQFLVEVGVGGQVEDLAELNRKFTAWVETVYHRRVHSETGQTPLERWEDGWARSAEHGITVAHASPAQLHEAFLWSAWRKVTKTATVSFEGNTYEVDPALAGRKVELVYDPFDLARIEVRYQGMPMGEALPHRIRSHVHRKARPDEATPVEPAATGIDYLSLVEARHAAELAERIQYSELPLPGLEPEATDGLLAVDAATGEVLA
ncbi:DDE-type integrase/transposase/recombinase [Sinomonas terrae]|uniref:DDE-type integrase/transposase/recombinase n=1 Tax=Sinomonas terrae TaxID=2908838 RepID=A0ABS9U3A8_9MICC|nr:DDE-type integrase/transposase/recombinase [Sinomonas terrae]MCH6471181.1 DDE-type integrase/transposase/recombinase [Sinomonas terrae]